MRHTDTWRDAIWPFLQVMGMIVVLLVAACLVTAWWIARKDRRGQ